MKESGSDSTGIEGVRGKLENRSSVTIYFACVRMYNFRLSGT